MAASSTPGSEDTCSFCGKPRARVGLLVSGEGGAFICDECVRRLLRDTTRAKSRRSQGPPGPPREHSTMSGDESRESGSFDRFTERARRVMALARDEAQRFNHNYVGTEHILLGLVAEGEGVAAQVLWELGVELPMIRNAVEFIIGRGERQVVGEIGLTPRAKKVIELADDEARRLGHHYVGTEHLLLGLIREGEGIAAGVLESRGVDLERVRTETIRLLKDLDISSEPEDSRG